MTDTAVRPLPVDLNVLRQHWLPAEPATTVTVALDAIRLIDALVSKTAAELDQRDQTDSALVAELVDAAIAGEDLDQHAARVSQLGDRPVLAFRLEQLRRARNVATHRHTVAMRNDPDYVAWQQECRRITAEWEHVSRSAETPEARYNTLITFAELH